MFVNHKRMGADDFLAIMSEISQLPSAFSERTARRTDDTIYRQSRAFRLANSGDQALSKWQERKDPKFLKEAGDHYRTALTAAKESGNKLIQSIAAGRYAEVAPPIEKNFDVSLHHLRYAVDRAYEYGAMDFASQHASRLHEGVYLKVRTGIENNVEPNLLNPWLETLKNVRQLASKLFRTQHGELIEQNAFRVEQGEVGFSNKEKMGTDLLAQCVCIVIRNPKTGITAFAHIDHGTNVGSLDKTLQRLGYNDTGDPLQVRLVGGNKEAHEQGSLQGSFYSSVADHNLYSLVAYLSGKNVDIVSADIMQKDQPSAITVNPETFDLSERIPGRENPDFFLTQARAMLSEPGKPLHVAFDLTRSESRAPILVTEQLAESLNHLAKMPIQDTYALFMGHGETAGALVAERVESVDCMLDTHIATVNNVLQNLSARIKELQGSGFEFDRQIVQSMIDTISTRSIYVGQHSEQANAGLIDFVRNRFITVGTDGKSLQIDWEGIQREDIFSRRNAAPSSHLEM